MPNDRKLYAIALRCSHESCFHNPGYSNLLMKQMTNPANKYVI